jgi:hypothetical protein
VPSPELYTVNDVLEELSTIVDGTREIDATLRPNYVFRLDQVMQRMIIDAYQWAFRAEDTLTLTANTRDYDLAGDFRALIEPSMIFTGSTSGTLSYIEHQEWDARQFDRSTGPSKPSCFTLIGKDTSGYAQVRFYKTPDAAYTLRYRYFAHPRSFRRDTSGNLPLDRRFPGWAIAPLVSGAAYMGFPDRLTPQEMATHRSTYEEGLRRLGAENQAVIGNVYQRQPFTAASGGRRRLWDGSGTTGNPWASGVTGPPWA